MKSLLVIALVFVHIFSVDGKAPKSATNYMLYNVNAGEGFNLRRDVYMRMAIFMERFHRANKDWYLVLPPWSNMPHWKSQDIGNQKMMSWPLFFDTESMRRFAPIQDFTALNMSQIDQVLVLQRYNHPLVDNTQWEDKWEEEECSPDSIYFREPPNGTYPGRLWGYDSVTVQHVKCVYFQGPTSMLQELLEPRSVLIDNAQIPFHDEFGGVNYWKCRRSMRFAKHLREEAAWFRKQYLNSSDEKDKTALPERWEDETSNRSAIGGPYLAVHLRRQDFLLGQPKEVPTLEDASRQISQKLHALGLDTVFIATDGTDEEFQKLKTLLTDFRVLRYVPSRETLLRFKDGGVAIVDQIICSHARYFYGTHESTFSFRIQEEREILGFPAETTFNRLCGDNPNCRQPFKWTIVR